MNYVYRK